jgi:SAM-dependent methyltransferase
MIEPNQATIEAYNSEINAYINKTPSEYRSYHRPMLNWMDTALEGLHGITVLEVGSATPRDARYIRSKGYSVQTSDASERFVRSLKEIGEPAILFNVLTDPIPGRYDLIFANAVAPHFTRPDLIRFLDKVDSSLTPSSRLAFNLKIGDGEAWINEKFTSKRFIQYWHPDEIRDILAEYDFKTIFFESDVSGDLPNHHWMNIVLEKE